MIRYILISLLILLLPTSAKEHKTEIIGEWLYSEKMDDGLLSSITSYRKNGEFTIIGILNSKDEYFNYTVKGKWHIKDNVIHYTLTDSNIPKYMKTGDSWTKAITSLDKKHFKYMYKGQEGSNIRLPMKKAVDTVKPKKKH